MTFDQHEAHLTAAIDGAFTEPDLFVRAMLFSNLMKLKFLRAGLYQGLQLKGPTHGDH